jgi:hypothetical protein
MTAKTLSPLLSGLLVTLTLANAADAGSLTYWVPIDTVTQEGWLPEFNPMLGRLVSVGVVADVSASGAFFLQDAVSSVDVSADVSFIGVQPTGPLLNLGSVSGFATEDFSTPVDFVSVEIEMGATYFVLGTALRSFYGTGDVNVQAILDLGVSDEAEPGSRPYSQGSFTVTYTFVAPEPSSLVIAATGAVVLLGYGCWRRFRSAA